MPPPELTAKVPFANLGRHHASFKSELTAAFQRVLGASSLIHDEEVERVELELAVEMWSRPSHFFRRISRCSSALTAG